MALVSSVFQLLHCLFVASFNPTVVLGIRRDVVRLVELRRSPAGLCGFRDSDEFVSLLQYFHRFGNLLARFG